jgi:hypothetical protein
VRTIGICPHRTRNRCHQLTPDYCSVGIGATNWRAWASGDCGPCPSQSATGRVATDTACAVSWVTNQTLTGAAVDPSRYCRLVRKLLVVLVVSAVFAVGCSQQNPDTSPEETRSPDSSTVITEKAELTPLVIRQPSEMIRPVKGSDNQWHLLYEIELRNATTLPLTVDRIEIFSEQDRVLELGQKAAAKVIEVPGEGEDPGTVGPAQSGYAFLTLAFQEQSDIPKGLVHEVTVSAPTLPNGKITTIGAETEVDSTSAVPLLGPPLENGSGYVAVDGCCGAILHTRAGLPINNQVWFAQRFAIDWEQLNEDGTLSKGDPTKVESYEIYGKTVLAAADGKVVASSDGMSDQTPGRSPGQSIGLEAADGNHVILEVEDGRFLLYAHLKKGSVAVKTADTVSKGQELGKVGNTGNSLVPHLHFHVSDRASALASDGEPYVIDSFATTGRITSAANFEAVETTGGKPKTTTTPTDGSHTNELPMGWSIVTFP